MKIENRYDPNSDIAKKRRIGIARQMGTLYVNRPSEQQHRHIYLEMIEKATKRRP